ncbi:MAG: HAD-IB family phosphatase [Candidatus Bathyarchaeia archaeon]
MTVILRLVAFDMDGTLLDGRVIYSLGDKLGFTSEIEKITASSVIPYDRSKRIAKLLKGLSVSKFGEIVRAIPLMKGAAETVEQLKNKNCKVGIISDSYTLATEIVACKLNMDFHVANTLVVRNGVITGHLKMPMGWEKIGCQCRQSVCKRYHLYHVAEKYGIKMSNTVAVGDSDADLCMLESAGIGILFNPRENNIKNVNYIVHGKDLRLIMDYLNSPA